MRLILYGAMIEEYRNQENARELKFMRGVEMKIATCWTADMHTLLRSLDVDNETPTTCIMHMLDNRHTLLHFNSLSLSR